MSETTTVPTFHVPSQGELNQLVEQQYQSVYPAVELQPRRTPENKPDDYFHAWETGVHDKALEEQAARFDLQEETTINPAVWERPATRPEVRAEREMTKKEIIDYAIVAGPNLLGKRHAFSGMNN